MLNAFEKGPGMIGTSGPYHLVTVVGKQLATFFVKYFKRDVHDLPTAWHELKTDIVGKKNFTNQGFYA